MTAVRRKAPKPREDLSPLLMAAFDRMAKAPLRPIPNWPRSVRIGIDYPLQVCAGDIKTDRDADAHAYICYVLGNLQKRDPPGDPPASCAAYDHAAKVGPAYSRAFSLLGTIRDCSAELAEAGEPAPCLPKAAMQVLQRAARGELVKQHLLEETLSAAETLARQLTDRVLRAPPGLR